MYFDIKKQNKLQNIGEDSLEVFMIFQETQRVRSKTLEGLTGREEVDDDLTLTTVMEVRCIRLPIRNSENETQRIHYVFV